MYRVDLDGLAVTAEDLRRCDDALGGLLDEAVARVAALEPTWEGLAADAHAAAQAEWRAGFVAMADGLRAMRAAAEAARDHYARGGAANLRMWEQVS